MSRRLAVPAVPTPFCAGGPRCDRTRLRKLQQMRLQGREPFPKVQLSSRVLATAIHASHDPGALAAGEHPGWRYVVAGRLVARRKHRHATFFDLQDQSGIIELCARRHELDHAHCVQLLEADIGDILTVEGTIYITDNHKLTLSVVSSQLLAKALRAPPGRANEAKRIGNGRRQRDLDVLANAHTRVLVEARSSATYAIREWMAQNSFLELEGPWLHPVGGVEGSLRLDLRRYLLGGLERVFVVDTRARGSDRPTRRCERVSLEWSVAYVDYMAVARQARELILHVAAALRRQLRGLSGGSPVALGDPWRTITVREGILQHCGLDLMTADRQALAACLDGRAGSGERSWGALVNGVYKTRVEPQLTGPTIVCELPLLGRALVKQHPVHDALSDSFEVVISGHAVASGHSELNDPHEQRARLTAEETLDAGDERVAPVTDDPEVRLLEYGLCPAAGAELAVDRLITLLIGARPTGVEPVSAA